MPNSFANKTKTEMLRTALQKLQRETPITAIGPGSVARSLTEAITDEIGDLYAAMDFNTSMNLVSTAQGRALDLIGQLYNTTRKQLGEIATIDQSVGAFYFSIDQTHSSDITIPQGTRVFTNQRNFVGEIFTYQTIADVTIFAGKTRAYARVTPEFEDSVFTAGKNTIVNHDFDDAPEGVTIKCTNPKAIKAQPGYESDENYRARIRKAVRTSAGGTLEAVRFAGLATDGIRDIKIRNHAYGLGSAEAIVVLESQDFTTSFGESLEAMQKVNPVGVRLFAREPEYLPLNMSGNVIVTRDRISSRQTVEDRARNGVIRYINTLLPGDKMVYVQLIQAIMDSSDDIVDVAVDSIRIGGRPVLKQNYKPKPEQQVVPGNFDGLTTVQES